MTNLKRKRLKMTNDVETIGLARRNVAKDPNLAIFIVRDLQIVKDAGLYDLAWAMYQYGCVRNEVVWLLDKLEKLIEKSESNFESEG